MAIAQKLLVEFSQDLGLFSNIITTNIYAPVRPFLQLPNSLDDEFFN